MESRIQEKYNKYKIRTLKLRHDKFQRYFADILNNVIELHETKKDKLGGSVIGSVITGIGGATGSIIAATELIALSTVALPVAIIGAITLVASTGYTVSKVHDIVDINKEYKGFLKCNKCIINYVYYFKTKILILDNKS